MDKSIQQLMDEKMCRPGYQWNETLQRCLGMGGGKGEVTPPEGDVAPKPPAPAKPVEGNLNTRGSVRVNSKGVKQTGTGMGISLPI